MNTIKIEDLENWEDKELSDQELEAVSGGLSSVSLSLELYALEGRAHGHGGDGGGHGGGHGGGQGGGPDRPGGPW